MKEGNRLFASAKRKAGTLLKDPDRTKTARCGLQPQLLGKKRFATLLAGRKNSGGRPHDPLLHPERVCRYPLADHRCPDCRPDLLRIPLRCPADFIPLLQFCR